MKKIYNTLLICAGLSVFPILANDNLTEEGSSQEQTSVPQFSQTLTQQALQDKIAQAITHYEQSPRDQWSYQISNYENEEGDISSSIEKFDPTMEINKQWTLLSINGETPTEKQQQKFAKNKLKRAEKNAARKEKQKDSKDQNFSLQFRELIQIDSLQLASETPYKLQANFNVNLEKLGKKASKKLRGHITYDKQQQFIEHIVITNTDNFSPVFSAEITDFKISFDFAKINDAILPQEYQLSMKGTFAFFTEIEEVSTNTFSDYRFVSE